MRLSAFRSPILLSSIISGILLSLAWPAAGFAPLLFVGFIPLLWAEAQIAALPGKNGWSVFGYSYLAFITWNVATTWWVYHASLAGGILAFVFNALFMAIVFTLFHITKRKLGSAIGYTSLVAYWMAFEYLHLQWELTWPWLTLGNGFASYYKWVQWYEYTGVFGGTLWIWVSNVWLFQVIYNNKLEKAVLIRKLFPVLLFIILPIAISYGIYFSYKEKKQPVEVVVVQPNIDPYNEKFSGLSPFEQLAKMLSLASTVIDSNTSYMVTPETALSANHWENNMNTDTDVATIQLFLKANPKVTYIGGVSSLREYAKGEKVPASARKFTDSEEFYDSYNTAMQLDKDGHLQLYHKSKLVPGVERMPFPGIIKYIDKFAINLGGMVGSLGTQDERSVFTNRDSIKVAPVICYESIFGEYVTEYIKNGAQFIFIITNDGWWGDTPGYRQHKAYARLRSIETRRSIARSANTGTSCFIDQLGNTSQETAWWEATVIKQSINANSELTFYVRFGDYLAKAAIGVTFIILGMLIFARFKK